jgi:hypothetical protein
MLIAMDNLLGFPKVKPVGLTTKSMQNIRDPICVVVVGCRQGQPSGLSGRFRHRRHG